MLQLCGSFVVSIRCSTRFEKSVEDSLTGRDVSAGRQRVSFLYYSEIYSTRQLKIFPGTPTCWILWLRLTHGYLQHLSQTNIPGLSEIADRAHARAKPQLECMPQ